MKILFLSNFYPPYEPGGQGQSCLQVVEGLKQRGHTTLVLTSSHRTDNKELREEGVIRNLHLEMDLAPFQNSITFFTRHRERERQNLRLLEMTVSTYQPDIIFIWGMWNLHRSLAALAESLRPDRVVYRFAEYWPTLPNQQVLYWQAPGRTPMSRLIKKMLSPLALAILSKEEKSVPLAFKHVICVSEATHDTLLEAGIPLTETKIINTGVVIPYSPDMSERSGLARENNGLELLYAGRLTPEKGLETAIEALKNLQRRGITNLHLTIAGDGLHDYEKHLKDLVGRYGLTDTISFLGKIPYEEMAALYLKMDLLILPSIWPEPLARVILEAWSYGLAVAASNAGGNKELIQNGENGMLFPPDDSEALAEIIVGLLENPHKRDELVHAGMKTISEKYSFAHMIDQIESYFSEILQNSGEANKTRLPVFEAASS